MLQPTMVVRLKCHSSSQCFHQWSCKVVKLLLAHPNINVNSRTRDGSTSFSIVCGLEVESVVHLLLKDPRVDITINDNERSPFWDASLYGHHEVIEWFIASDRDLGDVENKKGTYSWELQERRTRLTLGLCLKDSWPTQHRLVMNCE